MLSILCHNLTLEFLFSEYYFSILKTGEVLRGDRIVNTPYEVYMAQNIKCRLLCHQVHGPMNWNIEDSQKAINRIQHDYFVHL